MPTRLTPMATDGQGVLLAVNQSSDTRQRTTMDVLSRRVSHRLGCPVSVVQVQRGVPLMNAPLEQLVQQGVRNAVMVPVDPYQSPITSFDADGNRLEARVGGVTVNVRLAEGLGADPALVDAVLESLILSEREPDPKTAVLLSVPAPMNGIARRLIVKDSAVRAAGWAGLGFVDVPATVSESSATLPLRLSEPIPPRALIVPLAVNPGPFVNRCEHLAATARNPFADGVEFAPLTLHATAVLGQLIRERIHRARRN
jgi:sirohydrochlorin ferrochelatase